MTATTVSQFAVELKMPAAALLEQLGKAGVGKQESNDLLTDQDKAKLLDYLRRAHGDESKTKITLTRKETSEIKATDSHGRARTVQVEVRKKRVLVKREVSEHLPELPAETEEPQVDLPVVELAPEPEPIPEPVVEIAPVIVPVPEPEPEPEPIPEPEPVVEVAVVEVAPELPAVVVPPAPPTRASIIGEAELRSREAQDRRHNQLRDIQERELKAKQSREAELVRMRQQAEAQAVATKAAEFAKQQAALQAPKAPAPAPAAEKGTLHKKPDAPGKDAKKGGNSRADDGKKKPGIKTRSADTGSSWKSGRGGHKKHSQKDGRNKSDALPLSRHFFGYNLVCIHCHAVFPTVSTIAISMMPLLTRNIPKNNTRPQARLIIRRNRKNAKRITMMPSPICDVPISEWTVPWSLVAFPYPSC